MHLCLNCISRTVEAAVYEQNTTGQKATPIKGHQAVFYHWRNRPIKSPDCIHFFDS